MKNLLAVLLLLVILFRVVISHGSEQQAKLYAECGRIQMDCQSQCIHTALTANPVSKVVKESQKNNLVSRCINECYVEYIRCRGGR